MNTPTLPIALCLACVLPLAAQQPDIGPPFALVQPWPYDSGIQINPSGFTLAAARHQVNVPGAPSLRVFFSELDLRPGDSLHVTAGQDGHTHVIDALEARKWHDSSAFFNGDTLQLTLMLQPGSKGRFAISHLLVGIPIPLPETICGTNDDRVPLTDPRVARFLNSSGTAACSGWLAGFDGCAFTAGHCMGSFTSTAEFNVPPSTASGALQHPAPSEQFPIDQPTLQGVAGGVGDDWAVCRLLPNTLGESASARYGWFLLDFFIPASGRTMRVSGFGSGSGVLNQTLRTHSGPYVSSPTPGLHYQVDTTGGNSGSPVIDEATGRAIGIHTHAGCNPTGGFNSGTSLSNTGLLATWQATCNTTQFAFWMGSSGGGVGDFSMLVDHVPSGTVEGFTLFSRSVGAPVGTGPLAGLDPGALTFFLLTLPGAQNNVFHWTAPFLPAFYPSSPFDLPPGSVPFTAGEQLDGTAVALGPGLGLLGTSNVVRITF